jgi:hypothetical protein
VLTERLHHARHLTGPLPDGAVDTDDVGVLLVDDRVDGDGRLPRSPVADDELSLAAADGDHGVDRLEPRLEGLFHRLPEHDPWRHHVDLAGRLDGIHRAQAIDGLAQRIDHAPQVPGAGGDGQNPPGPPDLVTLLEVRPLPENDRADVVFFQVQGQSGLGLPGLGGGDLQHLAGHGLGQTVDPGDPVFHLQDLSYLFGVELLLVVLDLGEENVLDLAGS